MTPAGKASAPSCSKEAGKPAAAVTSHDELQLHGNSPITAAAATAAASSSTWLLPKDDFAYVFSSLTWNIDLLRLLLPHAPCPLHLPPSEEEEERASADTVTSFFKARDTHVLSQDTAITTTTAAAATTELENGEHVFESHQQDAAAATEAAEGGDGAEETTLYASDGTPVGDRRHAARTADADEESEGYNAASPSSLPPSPAGEQRSRLDDEEEAQERRGTVKQPPQDRADNPADHQTRSDAAVTTPTLTWSQYLFRSHASHPPQAQGTVVAEGNGIGGRGHGSSGSGTTTHPNTSTSIFHAHYLPSLEEFQRDLEARRQLQQQQHQQQQQQQHQQQYVMLSATRLEQHLLQQQQQQQRRRRTTANKTFFYSPTPSVRSLATTSATANALLDEEGEERKSRHDQKKESALSHHASPREGLTSAPQRISYAAVVAAAASPHSSPAPSAATTPSRAHQTLRLRQLRRRLSSTSSLDNLYALDEDDDAHGTAAAVAAAAAVEAHVSPGGASPHHAHGHSGRNNNNNGASLSASFCSRVSQQQQPSAMMMRAADRLRASIVSSAHDRVLSPAGQSSCSIHHSHQGSCKHKNNSTSTSPMIHVSHRCPEKRKVRKKLNTAAVATHKESSSDASSSDSDDGLPWTCSRASDAGDSISRSNSAFTFTPASPIASVSSMSLNRPWSSAVSGRATPRSSAGAAAGSASFLSNNNSSNNNSSGGLGASGSVGGGPTRRKKKNLRRGKAARTWRHSNLRVYVPSITEGPKAASLYTAPTAEAQELLLQLQHRAAALARSGATASAVAFTSARPSHLPAAPLPPPGWSSTPAVCAASAGVSPDVAAARQRRLMPAVSGGAGMSLSFTGTVSSISNSSSCAAVVNPTSDSAVIPPSAASVRSSPHHHPHHSNCSYLAVARASLSSPSLASPPTHPHAAEGATARNTLSPPVYPRPSSPPEASITSALSSSAGAADFAAVGVGERESGGECCDSASVSEVTTESHGGTAAASDAPPTPVELPNWVRERSLSALYYQPWGLELLARYEQQQQQQQQQGQAPGHYHHHRHNGSRPAPQSSALKRLPLSPLQHASDGSAAHSHLNSIAGSASQCTSLSTITSPALTPRVVVSAAGGTAAPRRPPALASASLGTTRAAATTAAVDTALPSAPRVSWAAALRQPHWSAEVDAPAASSGSRITATRTMTNSTTTTTAAGSAHGNLLMPDWPPELAAAEERDAREEAFYFFGATTPTAVATVNAGPVTSTSSSKKKQGSSYGGSARLSEAREEGSHAVHHVAGGEVGQHPSRQGNHSNNNNSNTNTTAATATASLSTQRSCASWLSGMADPPTLYLSRRKRPRRRLRASRDAATTRSSTSRRAPATSAATELQNKRVSACGTAAADAADTEIAEDGSIHTNGSEKPPIAAAAAEAVVASKDDLFLFGDTYCRKKSAQLYYPPPASWKAAPQDVHAKARKSCEAPLTSSLPATSAFRQQQQQQTSLRSAGNPEEAAATVQRTKPNATPSAVGEIAETDAKDPDAPTTIAEAAARLPLSSRHTSHGYSASEQQQQQQQAGCASKHAAAAGFEYAREASLPAAAAPTVMAKEGATHTGAAAATVAATALSPSSSASTATVSSAPAAPPLLHLTSQCQQQQQQQQLKSAPEVDINFFLQKFLRAVLVVVITQVRLQQEQQQQHQQQCRVRLAELQRQHEMTCPVSAYILDVFPECMSSFTNAVAPHQSPLHRLGSQLRRQGCFTSESSGLSVVERHALAFVRRHMRDYRNIITAYVMRDDKEVARRSMQPILSESAPTTTATTTATSTSLSKQQQQQLQQQQQQHGALTESGGPPRASDPLFQQCVFNSCLNTARVNGVYDAAVRNAGASTGYAAAAAAADTAAASTAVDDVEALRTAQLYISGKDAAWQPLLMEVLQVSRIVQCYSDGPLSVGDGADGVAAGQAAASATTPQQHLLSSLEKFLAQRTVPLLRPTTATATTAAAGNVGAASVGALSSAQTAAAAQMTDESEAFRRYLLTGYLRDPNDSASLTAAAPAIVRANDESTDALGGGASPCSAEGRAAYGALRHSQSAPALTAFATAAATDSSLASAQQARSAAAAAPGGGSPLFSSLLQPLTWYPYAYMPGIASPYAESSDPTSTRITPAQAATASAMTLFVTTLPLSGRLLWKWVIPAEDTDTFNLSVFFQSSLFTFMQGGPLPTPTNVLALPRSASPMTTTTTTVVTMAAHEATNMSAPFLSYPSSFLCLQQQQQQQQLQSVCASCLWPPMLAASIDACLRRDAARATWGSGPPTCCCGAAACRNPEWGDIAAAATPPTSTTSAASGTVSDELEEKEVVLVHCSAGMHRSCGILVAFLLWLFYQCRQVLGEEKRLRLRGPEKVGVRKGLEQMLETAVLGKESGGNATCASNVKGEEEEEGEQVNQRAPPPPLMADSASSSSPSFSRKAYDVDVVAAPGDGDSIVTSRLLQRIIRHVQQRRSIAVPIRTVQCLLQSFASELQLN